MIFLTSCLSEKEHISLKEEEELEENLLFNSGKNYYFSSLNFDLDPAKARNAINKFNQFVKKYPQSSKVKEAYSMLHDLLKKIEKKNYCIADSYFLMGRYKTSLKFFQDLIQYFPESRFKEKILYKICISQFFLSRKKDFFKSYNEYMKHFSYHIHAKKLKMLYKKLKKL
ncbi:outer membrane protein assembly factor BamD [Blattabacterium cuenoti]|uniref:outer membrane protein assembly factor BamD n=1 Tax=Blattabacterium cuenoti TaxID=1653831 RepID=UPI00163CE80A|nr:outer membrane protein assembly factor BamD [Blattabacterium cuenoti]